MLLFVFCFCSFLKKGTEKLFTAPIALRDGREGILGRRETGGIGLRAPARGGCARRRSSSALQWGKASLSEGGGIAPAMTEGVHIPPSKKGIPPPGVLREKTDKNRKSVLKNKNHLAGSGKMPPKGENSAEKRNNKLQKQSTIFHRGKQIVENYGLFPIFRRKAYLSCELKSV